MSRQRIAEELLGTRVDENGFSACPGAHLHSRPGGKRDFQVLLDGAPTAFCFHSSCSATVALFNAELRRRIRQHEGGAQVEVDARWKSRPPPRAAQAAKRPEVDMDRVRRVAAKSSVPADWIGWLAARSPLPVAGVTSGRFLDSVYARGEKVLVFTRQFSQGDYLHWVGAGTFRLSPDVRVRARREDMPAGGPEGVWFLAQPVSGTWEINARFRNPDGSPRLSRRSEEAVTAFRFAVLESDSLPPDIWIRVLAQVALPIAAIYSSGGRSIHALVRIDAASKAQWDAYKAKALVPLMCVLGADPAALTAVRLTRLPACQRGDRTQELFYLAPSPGWVALESMIPHV